MAAAPAKYGNVLRPARITPAFRIANKIVQSCMDYHSTNKDTYMYVGVCITSDVRTPPRFLVPYQVYGTERDRTHCRVSIYIYICNEDLSCKGTGRLIIKYKYYYHTITFPSYIYVSTFPIVHHMLQIDVKFRQRSNHRTSESVAGVRRGRLPGKELHGRT